LILHFNFTYFNLVFVVLKLEPKVASIRMLCPTNTEWSREVAITSADELSKFHNAALAQGYSPSRNVMKIWTLNNDKWVPSSLLVSGVSVFWFVTCGHKTSSIVGLDSEEYQWLKSQTTLSHLYCSEESLFDTISCYRTFIGNFLKTSVKDSTLQHIKFQHLVVGESNTFDLTLRKSPLPPS